MPSDAPPHVRARAGERWARLRSLGFRSYRDYLDSRHWRQTRQRYRESDLPQVCICGDDDIQLHHLTYDRLGEEELTDLTPLCRRCHQLVHVLEWRQLITLDLEGLCDADRATQARAVLAELAAGRERERAARLEAQRAEVIALPFASRLMRAHRASKRRHINISHELHILRQMTKSAASDRVITNQLLAIEERAYGWDGWKSEHRIPAQ